MTLKLSSSLVIVFVFGRVMLRGCRLLAFLFPVFLSAPLSSF